MRISEALNMLRELREEAGNSAEAYEKANQLAEYIIMLYGDCEKAKDERIIKQEARKFTPEVLANWVTEVSEHRKRGK